MYYFSLILSRRLQLFPGEHVARGGGRGELLYPRDILNYTWKYLKNEKIYTDINSISNNLIFDGNFLKLHFFYIIFFFIHSIRCLVFFLYFLFEIFLLLRLRFFLISIIYLKQTLDDGWNFSLNPYILITFGSWKFGIFPYKYDFYYSFKIFSV